jgi:hypothetical protein
MENHWESVKKKSTFHQLFSNRLRSEINDKSFINKNQHVSSLLTFRYYPQLQLHFKIII